LIYGCELGHGAPPSVELVDKGGVLVVRGPITEDLNDITRHERDARVLELLKRANR